MQAAVAVFLGLGLTLLLVRCKVPLGLGFLCGATGMGLTAGLGVPGTGIALGELAIAGDTWMFAGIVTLVFGLSSALQHAGSLDLLVRASGQLIRNRRVRVASLPALVGLLPMPGGAVVSAPLVEGAGAGLGLDARLKNAINYWYRHIWEVCWPLYPSMLLTAGILGSPVLVLSGIQLPLGLLLTGIGWVFLLRTVPGGADAPTVSTLAPGELRKALTPFLVVILGMPLFGWLLGGLVPDFVASYLGLGLAIVLALVVLAVSNGFRHVVAGFRDRRTWNLLVLAVGVKLFGGMVLSSGAAQETARLISEGGVPVWLAAVVLPLFVGFVSGNMLVAVSVAMLVLFVLGGGAEAGWLALLPSFVLAYSMGFAGYMLSPVHLCLILSSRFFEESVGRTYTRVAPPLLVFMVCAAGFFLIVAGAIG